MHEYSIVRALIDRVESEAQVRGALRVQRVCVSIGELSGVETDLLATAYTTFREATICQGADLKITKTEARWICPSCKNNIVPGAMLRCPTCGIPARLAGGDEIQLDRIEMEVP